MTDQPTPETVTTGAHNDALLRLHITTAERDDARADVARLRAALELIAVPMRPDGSYNRDRGACGSIARGALASLT